MNELAAEINSVVVEWILGNGRVPVEAVFFYRIELGWLDEPALTGLVIIALQASALAHGIDPVGIVRVGHGVEAVATADIIPIIIPDAAAGPAVGRAVPAAIVLHAAHHVVGDFIIHIDVVELAYGQVLVEVPAFAAVFGNA